VIAVFQVLLSNFLFFGADLYFRLIFSSIIRSQISNLASARPSQGKELRRPPWSAAKNTRDEKANAPFSSRAGAADFIFAGIAE
jgi:hypothetical protein